MNVINLAKKLAYGDLGLREKFTLEVEKTNWLTDAKLRNK